MASQIANLTINEAFNDDAGFIALLTRLNLANKEKVRLVSEGIESAKYLVDVFRTTKSLEDTILNMNRIFGGMKKDTQ